MLKYIDYILKKFEGCFKRKETFIWFVTIVFGLIVRSDLRGITSIVGVLRIKADSYFSVLHFFRSKAFDLKALKNQWIKIVMENFNLKTINERIFLIGDHTKVSKEARFMPGVKKHHQESENSGKPEYIYGHELGMIGVLTDGKVMQCVPVDVEIHDGSDDVNKLSNSEIVKTTSAEKLMQMVSGFVQVSLKKIFLLLDAGFSNGKVFEETHNINKKAESDMVITITRAKSNYVAYEKAERIHTRGREPKYGNKVKLSDLFKTSLELFASIKLEIYGKIETVQYLHRDLLWKQANMIIRFVLVKTGEKVMILMCSDLNIHPETIITAYTYRFKIEVSFKYLKHVVGAFCYHFWTKAIPKLSKFKTETDLSLITSQENIEKISTAFRATQIFTFIGCIALGILMMISENLPKSVWQNFSGWLRTVSSNSPSVETTRVAVQNAFNRNFRIVAIYKTLGLIQIHQRVDIEESVDIADDLCYSETG